MTPLTISVDARLVYDETRRGIAKTIIGTYGALAKLRPDWRFVLFHRTEVFQDPLAVHANMKRRRVEIRGDRFGLWEKVRLPWANLRLRPDVFHAPAGPAPRFPMAPMAVTINDLIPLEFRPNDADVVAWAASVRRAARNARLILTASEHAKGRIVELFGEPAEKIEVIPWAAFTVPLQSQRTRTPEDVAFQYTLPRDRGYVLHFGMADPRKNTARTIEAWARIPAELRERFVLLVVGVEGPAKVRFREQTTALGVQESVRLLGYLPEPDVRALLAGASLLCYPTTHEGFGLPILDGFAAGVPVLTGDSTSLPEVAGDAALMVDARSTDEIADGLAKLLADEGLRRSLVERGRERLKQFTWEKTAGRVAEVFERIAGRH